MSSTQQDATLRSAARRSYRIANSQNVAAGDYVVLDTARDVREVADTAGFKPLGIAVGFSQKDTADSTDQGDTSASRPPRVDVNCAGGIMEGQTVAGAAGDETDVGRKVYATAARTWTLTPTVNIPAVGEVVFSDANGQDIYLYPQEVVATQRSLTKELLAIIPTSALEANGDLTLYQEALQGTGRLARIYARPMAIDDDATQGSQNLQFQLGSSTVSFAGAFNINHSNANATADFATVLPDVTPTSGHTFSHDQTLTISRLTGGQAFAPVDQLCSWEIWAEIAGRYDY